MYLGLNAETALDCFDFSRYGSGVIAQGRKQPRLLREEKGLRVESLIGPEDTECFSMTRYILDGSSVTLTESASVWICAEGEGTLIGEDYEQHIAMGDYFFLPAAASGKITAESGKNLKIVCCMGGK